MSLRNKLKKLLKPSKIKIVGIAAFILLSGGISASLFSNVNATGSNCSTDYIISCGVPTINDLTTDYAGNVQKIDQVYGSSPFKMSSTEFYDFTSNQYVMGEVYADGNIFVNNKLVATDAWTAGRLPMSNPKGSTVCSNQYENSDGIWVRQPACSFRASPLEAYVYMPNGVFRFAVLLSCANPVSATPVTAPKLAPAYSIIKQVRNPGDANYVGSVATVQGNDVEYKITVKSIGSSDVKNIQVRDHLPANVAYIPGSLAVDGNHFDQADVTNFFGSKGVNVPDLAPGDQRIYTFSASVDIHDTIKTCNRPVLENNGYVWATGLPTKESNANVVEVCKPSTPPPANSLECNNLQATVASVDSAGNTTYDFTATASANNVKITSYVFDFDYNSQKTTVTTSNTTATTSFTFPVGTYNTTVTVYGQNGDTQTSASCAQTVSASTTPLCTTSTGATYPAGSAQCNTTTPPTTTTPSTPASSLPNTGPGSVVAMFAGASGLGAIGHWFYLYRKAKRI